jgi:hypothetical protein
MPVLRNIRHEKFAHAIARGAAVPQAYERAGYAPGARAAAAAARLSGKAELKARVAEIKSHAASAEPSVARMIDELEEARRLAIEIKQPAAAVSATLAKARIAGMIGEKADGKVATTLTFELSETEAARRIAFILRRGAHAAL